MRKILITYVSAGAGHRKAAEALYDYFIKNTQAAEIKLVDALDKSSFLFRNIYIYGYSLLINRALWLWRILFKISSLRWFKLINPLLTFLNRISAQELIGFLIEMQPDEVISTHFFPAEISAYLKKSKKINSRLITVITDFGVHPFWIISGADLYVVASSFTKKELLKRDIDAASILECGIPIDSKFSQGYAKDLLCGRFGLRPDKLTVLLTTGSFGIGPIEQIVGLLHRYVQLIVICANNKSLYRKLRYKDYPEVKVFGFIDNIQEAMAVSDIVVAKPGGLTTSEILSMELVPIFISPIPGQETINISAMKSYGIGEFAKNAEEVKEIVLDYNLHRDKLSKIKERMKSIKKPFAAGEIFKLVLEEESKKAGE